MPKAEAAVDRNQEALALAPLIQAMRLASASGPANAMSVVQREWHTVAGQKGDFEGDEAYHHIHRVGGEEHYKYGIDNRSRVNFYGGGRYLPNMIAKAIDTCENYRSDKTEGQDDCLTYLRGLQVTHPVVAPVRQEPTTAKAGKKASTPSKAKPQSEAEKQRDARMAARQDDIF